MNNTKPDMHELKDLIQNQPNNAGWYIPQMRWMIDKYGIDGYAKFLHTLLKQNIKSNNQNSTLVLVNGCDELDLMFETLGIKPL